MVFDVYGWMRIAVDREHDTYVVYRIGGEGTRQKLTDLVIPPDLGERDIPRFLDDAFHEWARPGQHIRRIS